MNYHLKITSWDKDKTALSQIRNDVFIVEQSVPQELEWDEHDSACIHILVTDNNNKPIATARMKSDGHIGRMAVLSSYRKRGIGSSMLNALLKSAADKKIKRVYLHAQTSAIPFYEKYGFKIYTEEFMDAGIPHRSMQLELI